MVATVGTAMMARSSAGTIVQPISSARVAVDLLRVLVAARRGTGTSPRGTTVATMMAMPTTIAMIRIGMKRLSIFWACGPLGCERVLPVVLDLGAPGEDEGDGSDGGEDEPASPRAAWRHVPFRVSQVVLVEPLRPNG